MNMRRRKDEPKVEFQRIPDNPRQIRVLTYQSADSVPVETIVDIIRPQKRSRAKSSAVR
jgi:hypothetical protein